MSAAEQETLSMKSYGEEHRPGMTHKEVHRILSEVVEGIISFVKDEAIKEVYRLIDGRFRNIWSIQDQCLLAKREMIEKVRYTETESSTLRDLDEKWVLPKLKD